MDRGGLYCLILSEYRYCTSLAVIYLLIMPLILIVPPMEHPGLEQWSWIALIAGTVASIVMAVASTGVAVIVFRWQREGAKIDTTRRMQEDLRHYNELILLNEKFYDDVVKTHPWGTLAKDDVAKMGGVIPIVVLL